MSTIVQTIGFMAAFATIVAYFVAAKHDKIAMFNTVNFITSCFLVPCNVYFGSYFAATLSAAYGVIGVYGVVKERRNVAVLN